MDEKRQTGSSIPDGVYTSTSGPAIVERKPPTAAPDAKEPGCTCPERCVLHNLEDAPAPGELRGESFFAPLKRALDAANVAPEADIADVLEATNRSIAIARGALSRFVCGYCRKPLAAASSECDCVGWKAATAKLQSMARENVIDTSSEPAVRQVVLSSVNTCFKLHTSIKSGLWRCDREPGHEDPCSNLSKQEVAAPGAVPCPSCGAELAKGEFEAAGCGVCGAKSLPEPEGKNSSAALELPEQWVTCDVRRDPHVYSGSCRGVVQSVPAPVEASAPAREAAVDISRDPRTGGVRFVVAPSEKSPAHDDLEDVPLLTDAARKAYLRGPVPSGFVLWSESLERWLALGRAGLTVSICYGPVKPHVLSFSVDVLSTTGQTFEEPIAAGSFEQAVEIAETEALKRGWLPQ
jgi:hypothetical protein